MTRQPSDAFLPSGGFDRDILLATSPPTAHEPSHSHLQPISEYQYDAHASASTSTPGATAAPRFAPTAPHFHYATSHMPFSSSHPSIRRDSSLSPTDIGIARAPRPSLPPTATGRDTLSPNVGVGAALTRSASADAAAPQQTSIHLVQRLSQQNSLIREAWEAERKYLEANRKRAEEVYQEERTIMEDERESWMAEKAAMEREMQTLRDRVSNLETENAGLKSITSPASQLSGLVSPAAGVKLQADSLPPGLEGASRRPHFVNGTTPRTSPTNNSDASLSTALDPRTQPQNSSSRDFLASRKKTIDLPMPLIDVTEIDPKLDGIFIKANAVRDTFTQSSVKTSPATSPPTTDQSSSEHEGGRRSSSKAQTMQALAAGEIRRRTMHAGHTPNHSLSLFPTMTTLDGSMTAGQSEATTPTSANKPVEHDDTDDELERSPEKPQEPREPREEPVHSTTPPVEAQADGVDELQMEPHLEPIDDVPLKGPLMIKNIPAQDEIFWAQVNQKLQGISHSEEDALPTVIRSQLVKEPEPAAEPKPEPKPEPTAESQDVDVPEGLEAAKPIEADVPLKIRTTANFGAPFGVV